MIALTWDRTWDLYIWALFTSPWGMNSAIKIRRLQKTYNPNIFVLTYLLLKVISARQLQSVRSFSSQHVVSPFRERSTAAAATVLFNVCTNSAYQVVPSKKGIPEAPRRRRRRLARLLHRHLHA